jgi:hypothetical protein
MNDQVVKIPTRISCISLRPGTESITLKSEFSNGITQIPLPAVELAIATFTIGKQQIVVTTKRDGRI